MAKSKFKVTSLAEHIDRPEITIGEYTIREQADGSFYISRGDGESMCVDLEALEEMLADFFRENF